MDDNDIILQSSERLISEAKKLNIIVSTAESCTGGMLASFLTSIPGSSAVFDIGFITYSNSSKIDLLNVNPNTIDSFGAVSDKTAREMALGAVKNSKANLAVAITGVAGPGGGTKVNPVGTVHIATSNSNNIINSRKFIIKDKGRDYIRKMASLEAINMLSLSIR
ncbi:MAG: damage-inducible protein CinA [Rhodobiaceae bacterium]|jgi:nicotinamide-nucleotide amidase|nr:damage-inducible protein CinA [Rhodobiaceae bacterium]|tara:strand:+ start:2860 stop:3354 length:495 start_codon:yes stop_codon:yes gene_type:complete